MRVSLNWIKKYVDIPAEISDYYYKTKPTNGEFIAIIVDKLMMEEGRTSY